MFLHGRGEEALRFIRDCWGMMLRKIDWTWLETFNGGSSCHAWSSCPTHYLSAGVLGVTFPEPGNPNLVCIDPHPCGLQWAAGVYPLPAGPLSVEWRIKGERLFLHCEAPPEVEVQVVQEV